MNFYSSLKTQPAFLKKYTNFCLNCYIEITKILKFGGGEIIKSNDFNPKRLNNLQYNNYTPTISKEV